jgi:hypothetical protein
MLSSQLLLSLHTHPSLMAADGLHDNPHFVPPRIHARQDERAQFRFWLEGISPSFTQIPASQQPSSATLAYNLESPELLIAEGTGGQWKIRCFGTLRVYRADGSSIGWRTPQGATKKVKTLFAYLLFRGEQGADADELVDLLWPKARDLKQGLNRLHHTVNCLRTVLHQGQHASFVRQENHRYALAVPEHTWLDYPMFQQFCYQSNALELDELQDQTSQRHEGTLTGPTDHQQVHAACGNEHRQECFQPEMPALKFPHVAGILERVVQQCFRFVRAKVFGHSIAPVIGF